MKITSVFDGIEDCKVYDEFNVNRSKNSCQYNHCTKKCIETFKRPQVCYKCAGYYDTFTCNTKTDKCINCINASIPHEYDLTG